MIEFFMKGVIYVIFPTFLRFFMIDDVNHKLFNKDRRVILCPTAQLKIHQVVSQWTGT